MIDVEHLCKDYGTFRALDDVTFHVDRGEVVGFLGPNGAGKTTTMRILTGYMPPTEGRARVAGFDVFEDSLAVRKRIGYLPESVPLYGEMSVRAYLDYMASLRRVPERRKAIWRAMEACHIEDRADSLIGKLSKGLRQRVGLAQAILHDPEVLILDEPTIGLDPKQIIEVRELIRELGTEHTVILSTHILPEVSQTCSRVLIIHNGKIAAEGRPEDLIARLQGAEYVHVRIGNAPVDADAVLSDVEDVVEVQPQGEGSYHIICAPSTDRRPQLARAVVERGWDLLELRTGGMSLEDIFLRLTTDEAPTLPRIAEEEEGSPPQQGRARQRRKGPHPTPPPRQTAGEGEEPAPRLLRDPAADRRGGGRAPTPTAARPRYQRRDASRPRYQRRDASQPRYQRRDASQPRKAGEEEGPPPLPSPATNGGMLRDPAADRRGGRRASTLSRDKATREGEDV